MSALPFMERLKASANLDVKSALKVLRDGELPMKGAPSSAEFLEWSSLDQIGIVPIDDQHRMLVTLLNRLHHVLVRQRDRPAAQEIFQGLIQSTRNHFSFEEQLLINQRCPGYQAHFKQHSEALAEILDLYHQFNACTLSAQVLLVRLRACLVGHTREADRRVSGWMNFLGAIPPSAAL